jgi:hypothetical protein
VTERKVLGQVQQTSILLRDGQIRGGARRSLVNIQVQMNRVELVAVEAEVPCEQRELSKSDNSDHNERSSRYIPFQEADDGSVHVESLLFVAQYFELFQQ